MKAKLIGFTLVTLLVASGIANGATYLVYDPGGTLGQNRIVAAMDALGSAYDYDLRTAANPVTAADLSSHAALVVGFSYDGDYSGLSSSLLAGGIIGNRLITGHDADYHASIGNVAATTLFERYLTFASGSTGLGLLAFPSWGEIYAANPFHYLPGEWGVTAVGDLREEEITAITAAGVESGLYAGLTTADLSNWSNSFHSYFTGFQGDLESFELGASGDVRDRIVTIGTTVTPVVIETVPEPSTFILFGAGVAGFCLMRRRMKK